MKVIIGIGSKHKNDVFSQICLLLKNISDSVTFEFRDDGIYSQGLGFDQISMYEFLIKKEWCDFYEINECDAKVISLSSSILQKIFNTRQDGQFITISYDNKPDKINIIFRNKKPTKNDIPKEFEITLMDIDYETLEIPDNDYTSEFGISTKIFGTIVDQMEIFNENLRISCSEENIEFTASGIEGSLAINLFSDKIDYVTEYAIEEDKTLELTFPIKHFQNFCKFSKISKEVKLFFSDAYPMQMVYCLDTGDAVSETDIIKENSYIRFCLAPKIVDIDE